MKDEHTYGKKMARKGRTKVIYKVTFICIQTLAQALAKADAKVDDYCIILTQDSESQCLRAERK